MKKLITVALSLLFVVCLSYTAIAGSLDSPGAPSAGSGMYTLQNLYDYIVSGAALDAKTGFQEPAAAPGSTMKTTKEIGDALKASFEECPVTAADVKSGVKFFCTQSGSWGVRTGTAQLVPTPTPTSTPTPSPTLTPTATPTVWDSAACSAKGGYWSKTRLPSPDDYGCWFAATSTGASCTAICTAKSLTCKQANWDDDADCSVCRNFHPGMTCSGYYGASHSPCIPFMSYCHKRSAVDNDPNFPQDCSAYNNDDQGVGHARLCVCQQ